jgi:hypothetical protein
VNICTATLYPLLWRCTTVHNEFGMQWRPNANALQATG